LKSENTALQKNIEVLESQLAEALEKEDQLRADVENYKFKSENLLTERSAGDTQRTML
jgi:molecular chaperone GrpE (heat shock protein)